MSATINSSFKMKGFVTFLNRYRSDSLATQRYLRNTFFSAPINYKHSYYINSGRIRFMSEKPARQVDHHTKPAGLHVVKDEEKKPSQKSGLFTWGKWLLGSAVAIWLSFLQQGRRLQVLLGGKVEEVAEEIEEVAEVVDKVAIEAEKVSADLAKELPDSLSKLKEAALIVENVSTIAASDAQFAIQFVRKVEELKQDFQDLETMAKPLVDKIKQQEIENNK